MNILITGGHGFLGSSVAKRLVKQNHNILVAQRDFYLHGEDISLFSPDVVILFGWSGGNNNKDTNKLSQFYDNIPQWIKSLEFIGSLVKRPKIIGVGSFAEYGDCSLVVNEEYTENPNSFYGLSKLTAKQYTEMYCLQNGLEFVWIRPCFIYGPNDVKTRLIPSLISKFLNNENVELDECNVILDYLYIDDFVDFVYELIISKNTGVYNICSGHQYKLKEIIKTIKKLTNSKSKVIFQSSLRRQYVGKIICGSNNKIKNTLNISNKISIIDGLKLTINSIKKIICKI